MVPRCAHPPAVLTRTRVQVSSSFCRPRALQAAGAALCPFLPPSLPACPAQLISLTPGRLPVGSLRQLSTDRCSWGSKQRTGQPQTALPTLPAGPTSPHGGRSSCSARSPFSRTLTLSLKSSGNLKYMPTHRHRSRMRHSGLRLSSCLTHNTWFKHSLPPQVLVLEASVSCLLTLVFGFSDCL